MASYGLSGVIHVFRSTGILNSFEKMIFTPLACSQTPALSSDRTANTFSLAATATRSGVNKVFLKKFLGLPGT